MRNRNRRWILFWFLVSILQVVTSEDTFNTSHAAAKNNNGDKNQRSIFTPRMDYDQWKPVGRGDPLKNDPTYDYVPPVLDRVHYWVEPALRKPDATVPGESQKTEILLLGITSKKPAATANQADSRRDTYDPYVKYVDGPKFNPNQRISRPSFIPSIPTSFFPSFFSQNKNKYSDRAAFSKGTEQRVPYTMLMPPPVNTIHQVHPLPITQSPPLSQMPIVFQPSTTTTTPKSVSISTVSPSVTVQAANLVYHSSSLTNENEFKNKKPTITSSIRWEEATTNRVIPDFRDNVVYNTHLAPPESYIRIEFAPHNLSTKPLVTADSNHNINYVTPPPLIQNSKEIMFMGQVSDDHLDESNTYVKIGKPEAEVHSSGMGISNIEIEPIVHHPAPMMPNMVMFPHVMKPSILPSMPPEVRVPPPMSMQELDDMQTMHPPPITQSPVYTQPVNTVAQILENEKQSSSSFEEPTTISETPNYIASSSSIQASIITQPVVTISTPAPTTSTTTTVATTTVEVPTTTITSLTTDPLFKHYKQPVEPMKGPLYLIIEGHSKVKTYGPSKQIHGIMVQETNEISDAEDKYQKNYEIRHLHGFRKEPFVDDAPRKARTGNLQTLKHVVQTGLGAIDISDINKLEKRSDTDTQEAELQVGYEVVDSKDATTEVYHKGIVEEARKLKL